MKGIIIDDEPLVREDLRHILSVHPDISIIGEAGTVSRAALLLRELQPDVVFLDIQLIGGTGFDLLPLIPPATKIIFFTSYEEYAVRAFEVNALDYLLKPVSAERLAESLARLRVQDSEQPSQCQPAQNFRKDDRIFIQTENEQRFIPVQDILAVTSAGGNYSSAHLKGRGECLVRRTLKQWEEMLPTELFLRIHRSSIIQLNRIQTLHPEINGTYQVLLSGIKQPFTVSRRAASLLKVILTG